jgi:hypothetical protein
MEELYRLLGQEMDSEELCRALYFAARGIDSPVVGAVHITCADEAERKCTEAFQQHFSQYLLPELKFGERSHFRLANLGGRYEWGAVRIAEEHFATEASREAFKLLVVKVNSHVSLERTSHAPRFGVMPRYERESTCCGALQGFVAGMPTPFADSLREVFHSEGKDRVAVLQDPEKVPEACRPFFTAVANARLQARRALVEIQDFTPTTPTLYLVLPCVTLNQKQRDTEIACGLYTADARNFGPPAQVTYRGVSDDPANYELREELGRVRLHDNALKTTREARDHRALALERLRQRGLAARTAETLAGTTATTSSRRTLEEIPPEAQRVLRAAQEKQHHDIARAKPILKALLRTAAHVDPVSSAVLAFAEGLASIHNIYRVERLVRDVSTANDTREILEEVHNSVDQLSPERARDVIDVLAAQYPS